MSLYIMIAAGHMAFMNLGYGWAADEFNVRILLVGPGLLWMVTCLFAFVSLVEIRSLVRRGRFLPLRAEPAADEPTAVGGGS